MADGNAVWLYIGNELSNNQELSDFTAWCGRNSVNRVLLQVNAADISSGAGASGKITNLIDVCKANGIEVHGMISALFHSSTERSKLPLQHGDCYCMDYHGISNWEEPLGGRGYLLDPTSPEVKDYACSLCCKILEAYPSLSGIHLDFIRYFHYDSKLEINTHSAGHFVLMLREGAPMTIQFENGSKATYFVEKFKNIYNDPPVGDSLVLRRNCYFCFCGRCLSRFSSASGIEIPEGLKTTQQKADWIISNHMEEWSEFHAQTITSLVESIRNSTKQQNPSALLSAAIWYNSPYGNELRSEAPDPGSEYRYFGQKWWQWCLDGLVDFLCPMDYWLAPQSFKAVVEHQIKKVEGTVPVYAGLLNTREYALNADQLKEYRNSVRNAGAQGLCYFHYGAWKSIC